MKIHLLIFFLVAMAESAFAASADPVVIKAIERDLDALVGDTADEGSWDANISSTECQVKTSRGGDEYTCEITFIVTPYEGEDLGSESWESTCSDVRYILKSLSPSVVVERVDSSIDSCLETLSEGP